MHERTPKRRGGDARWATNATREIQVRLTIVDVYVNGEPVLTDVAYTTISDYLPLPAGTQKVTVYATGDTSTPVIDTPVEVAAGGAYTIAAVGLVADDSLTA